MDAYRTSWILAEYGTSIIDGTEEEFFSCSIKLTFFIALIGAISGLVLLRVYIGTNSISEYNYYNVNDSSTLVNGKV